MSSGDQSLEDFLLEERKKHAHATGELNGLFLALREGVKSLLKTLQWRAIGADARSEKGLPENPTYNERHAFE